MNPARLLLPDDLHIVALTLYGECRGEPLVGQWAVGWVIRNRVETSAWWGATPTEVCLHSMQFSCWNTGATALMAVPEDDPDYLKLCKVAQGVFQSVVLDPVQGATTYKVTGTSASWDAAVAETKPIIIGKHSFWRLSPAGVIQPWKTLEEEYG